MSSAPLDCDFNVFVGAETGLLKGISINPKANIAKNFQNLKFGLSKKEEITCMSWNQQNRQELLIGLRNQTVKVFDTIGKIFVESVDVSSKRDEEENFGAIRGVARFDDALVTAAESGLVTLWRSREDDSRVSFNTIDVEVQESGKLKKNDFKSDEERLKHLVTLKAGRTLCTMSASPGDPGVIATGGKENDLQVWDLNRPEAPTFRAKNVRPDFLELRVPVWVTDVCFPDPTTSGVLASVNRHGHIRLYDTRVGGVDCGQQRRRPVMELTFPEQTLTAISATPSKDQVLVGTASGQMALFDFRKESKGMFRKYKGCVGSVRSIDCSRQSGYFATVGLDRFLRIYSISSKKIVQKMYLKSRLNCVLLNSSFDPEATEQDRLEASEKALAAKAAAEDTIDSDIEIVKSEDEEENEDPLWDTMKVVGSGKELAKRRKIVLASNTVKK